jgi:hypothetical protein
MGKASGWQFTKRFRRGGFGWRVSRLASERFAKALAEIRAAAHLRLERIYPAVSGMLWR